LPARVHEATRHRVIAYDRAGFGQTPLPSAEFSIVDELDALHAMLDQHGARRIVIVAASYGALFAVDYAKQHPENVVGLVLLDPMNADFVDAVGIERVIGTVPKIEHPLRRNTGTRQLSCSGPTERNRVILESEHYALWAARVPRPTASCSVMLRAVSQWLTACFTAIDHSGSYVARRRRVQGGPPVSSER
jgi:pimeloyl-ACP methyl ester carboxylesterase